VATVVRQSAGRILTLGQGNLGDITLSLDGAPLLQTQGVVMASPNTLAIPGGNVAPRAFVSATGPLTENDAFGTGTTWLATADISGAGVESNFPLTMAYFTFEESWISGHISLAGAELAGNLDRVNVVHDATAARFLMTIDGVDASRDGLLFVIDANNQNSANIASTMVTGSGWEVRVYDQGETFPNSGNADFSFVYIPYNAVNLTAGRINDNGTVISSVGDFEVSALGTVGEYLLKFPDGAGGYLDNTDGMLVLTVNKAATLDNVLFAPDDNFLVHEYRAASEGFIVKSLDLPNASNQVTQWNFAFVRYDQPLAVPEPGTGGLAALVAALFLAWIRPSRRSGLPVK
jgi:hypothetical protein